MKAETIKLHGYECMQLFTTKPFYLGIAGQFDATKLIKGEFIPLPSLVNFIKIGVSKDEVIKWLHTFGGEDCSLFKLTLEHGGCSLLAEEV